MFFANGEVEAIAAGAEGLCREAGSAALLLVGQDAPIDPERLVGALNRRGVPFLGGIFPAVFRGADLAPTGAVVLRLPAIGDPFIVSELSGIGGGALLSTYPNGPPPDARSAVVLVDGLSAGIDAFLTTLFDTFGDGVSYFGVGAGRLTAEGYRPGRCLLTPDGVLDGAAAILLCRRPLETGVRHGWRPASGPVVATRTSRNRIYELNWRPALGVYLEEIGAPPSPPPTGAALRALLEHHPLGLRREGEEALVRVVVAADEQTGTLVCGGEILEHSVLDILASGPDALIGAAGSAADLALAAPAAADSVLVADCVSRYRILGDRFTNELEAVAARVAARGGPAPEGALSLGEISAGGTSLPSFLNQTVVVGAFHG